MTHIIVDIIDKFGVGIISGLLVLKFLPTFKRWWETLESSMRDETILPTDNQPPLVSRRHFDLNSIYIFPTRFLTRHHKMAKYYFIGAFFIPILMFTVIPAIFLDIDNLGGFVFVGFLVSIFVVGAVQTYIVNFGSFRFVCLVTPMISNFARDGDLLTWIDSGVLHLCQSFGLTLLSVPLANQPSFLIEHSVLFSSVRLTTALDKERNTTKTYVLRIPNVFVSRFPRDLLRNIVNELNFGSIEFRMGDLARGRRRGASGWS
jgi:hypothetical protein